MIKKILFLIDTLSYGGAEKVLVDTVNNMSTDKYDITVQTIYNIGPHISNLKRNIKYKSIVKTKNAFIRKIFSGILLKLIPTKMIYQIFVKADYDYEIAFLSEWPTKIITCSTSKKSKKISWLHETMSRDIKQCYAFKNIEQERKAYNSLDAVACVSEDTKKSLINRLGNLIPKVDVVYNVFDSDLIISKSLERTEINCIHKPMIVSVGRLEEVKGYDRLLRVHKRLIYEGQAHSLVIIGEGSKHKEYAEYILENNLQETAILTGFKENPYNIIKMADLFICSSYSEGFSTAVSESVVLGIPVISTKVSGVFEPYEMPRCCEVIENTEEDIYRVLKELLSNPEKLAGYKKEALRRKEFFTKRHLISQLEKYIDNV